MASGSSSTPVKVPSSAASYTPATLDPDLRSQINSVLIKDGHVTKIQEHLLHALHAHPTNWPTAVQSHALSLLRSGEVTTFPALVRRVLDDVRHQTNSSSSLTTNGVGATNGSAKKDRLTNGSAGREKDEDRPALALPGAVVEDALRVTRESLDMVCEIDGDGAT